MPYQDGHTHSEPGLYAMPNGDLILQFWRTGSASGTKQLRSIDEGRTWRVDLDRIQVQGRRRGRGRQGDRHRGFLHRSRPSLRRVHGSYDLREAIEVGRVMEELGFVWLEEPFHEQKMHHYQELCTALDMAVMGW